MKQCVLCGWPLNGQHAFNVHCPAANAQNDQLEAEVRDAMAEPWTEQDQQVFERGLEVARETIAFARFTRELRP